MQEEKIELAGVAMAIRAVSRFKFSEAKVAGKVASQVDHLDAKTGRN
jgi:hypothetical protein